MYSRRKFLGLTGGTALAAATTAFRTAPTAEQRLGGPSGQLSGWTRKYEAEDCIETLGAVYFSWNEGDQPAGLDQPLTGYSGRGFLDFANPVPDSNYEDTIPAGIVGATWKIDVPKSGMYQLHFVYNNPATDWGGNRNARDERNMRVNVNGNSYLDPDGWIGWMIFNVSGYNDTAQPGATQTAATVGQNTKWNNNYMNVPLKKGENTLRLSLEAPPGQAVYDGPNLDYFTVTWNNNQYTPKKDVHRKTGAFAHPGIFNTMSQLEAMKAAVNEPGSMWNSGYQELLASPYASSDYSRPDGYYTVVDQGPYDIPNIGGTQFVNDSTAVYYNALAWYLTGDVANAQKAIEILNGWSSTLQSVVDNNAQLLVAEASQNYLNGAEILRSLYNSDPSVPEEDKWSAADMEQFDWMVMDVFYKTIGDYYPQANGNWDALMTAANMAIGIYENNHRIFNQALEQFYRGDVVSDTASMGALPNYLYPTGECQESSRDEGHVSMGLSGLSYSSRIASNQGLDIFSAYDNRLLTGAAYYTTYNLGLPVVSQTFISDGRRGDPSTPILEILSNHYHHSGDNSQDLTIIDQALTKWRPGGSNWLNAMLFQDAPSGG